MHLAEDGGVDSFRVTIICYIVKIITPSSTKNFKTQLAALQTLPVIRLCPLRGPGTA
jgi:hypothetical protein